VIAATPAAAARPGRMQSRQFVYPTVIPIRKPQPR
jgi:hypothetical protein